MDFLLHEVVFKKSPLPIIKFLTNHPCLPPPLLNNRTYETTDFNERLKAKKSKKSFLDGRLINFYAYLSYSL